MPLTIRLGITASILAVAAATVGPWLAFEQVQFQADLAVATVSAVAIIMTAAFAAENLLELRRAREGEYTPFLDALLTRRRRSGSDPKMHVSLRNIGRGAAARVAASLWWPDADMKMWLPHQLPLGTDLIKPGESCDATIDFGWTRALVQRHLFEKPNPSVVLELEYRDALGRKHREFRPFDFTSEAAAIDGLVESIHQVPSELGSSSQKKAILEERLSALAAEHGLESLGIQLSAKIEGSSAQIEARVKNEPTWTLNTTAEQSTFAIIDWVESEIPALIRKASDEQTEAAGEPGVLSGSGTDEDPGENAGQ